MIEKSVSLDEFVAEYQFWGDWEVAYTDKTHLQQDEANEYVKLGSISIDYNESASQTYPILPFTFQPVSGEQIENRFSELKDGEKQAGRARKIILDQLTDSLLRSGLVRPKLRLLKDGGIQDGFREIIEELSKHQYLILFVDTGAIRRGCVSFLHKILPKVSIWTVVPVFVMVEVQRQIGELNKIFRKIEEKQDKSHPGKCSILEQRPQVSCVSRELNYIKQWRPVEILTTLPEMLGQSNGQSKVDRLIIESVKNLKRDRGLHHGVYLMTSDKDMASLSALENVNSLYIGTSSLPNEVKSIRFDSQNRTFILSPVHYLLWDLAQVFSTIRVSNAILNRQYELVYYSNARDGFFAHDIMEIRES
ncbi:MAG: hypothetical protein KDJ65_02820 [Anaerolineae bacterium]|nr:hypothetical protein [Anaerolineae bacterium]